MFEREHHVRIAVVLEAMNGHVLEDNACLFGSGTAMALRFGEYRESLDLDFLVSKIGTNRRAQLGLPFDFGLGTRAGTWTCSSPAASWRSRDTSASSML